MFNNDQNFNNNFNNNTNSFFQNYSNNIDNQNSDLSKNNFNLEYQTEQEMPPELGDIKNLSDATVFSAPTMDVLSPMNVMPENIPQQDLLDKYENGNLNNFESSNTTLPNQTNQEPSFLSPGIIQNTNNSYDIDNNYSVNNDFNLESSFINSDNISKNVDGKLPLNLFDNTKDNEFDVKPPLEEYHKHQDNLNDELDSKEESYTILDNKLNNIDQQDNDLIKENDYKIIDNKKLNDEDINLTKKPNQQSQDSHDENDIFNEINKEEKEEIQISKEEESTSEEQKQEEENENDDYEIVEDKKINDDDLSQLQDLGIENSYDTEDTLDIMDINEEEQEETENKEEKSTKEIVDKIKDLVEELKTDGKDINIEEFDFEKMYQIIIKIDK